VVNKWDLAEKDDKASAKYEKAAFEKAPFLKFVPFLFTSALTGQRVNRVLEVLLEVEAERAKRISTSEVNQRLGELVAKLQPPQAAGRDVRLNYATQVETAPPTIAVFGNNPDLVEEHYVRYLHNGFRASWGFTGNPSAHRHAPQIGIILDRHDNARRRDRRLVSPGVDTRRVPRRKSRGIDLRKQGSETSARRT
jgi:GTP-binding protein